MEAARAHAERAVKLNSGSVATQMLLGDLLVAEALRKSQVDGVESASPQLEQAREAYTAALEIDPEDIGTLMARARLARLEGDASDAAFYYGRVLNVDPDHFDALLELSDVSRSAGDYEDAARALWRARQLDRGPKRRIPSADYQQRMIELYELLLSQEKGTSPGGIAAGSQDLEP